MTFIDAEQISKAAHRMAAAAQEMHNAAARMEAAFFQRRQWEEEYLQRIEAIVREELDFYQGGSQR